jgi:hypothetical protein
VGFGRACAPVRCAHPSFWVHHHAKRGAVRPPAHRSFAVSYSIPKNRKENYRTRAARVMGFPDRKIVQRKYIAINILAPCPPPPLPPASIGCPSPPYTENRKTLHFCIDPLVSVNFCDFLTPTDAVIENPQKYFAAEKYY